MTPARERSIADLARDLASGQITSVQLTQAYLDRIERLDHSGPCLNAMPVLNPAALEEARQSDARRARGEGRGILEGIPYAVKDNFRVAGLTVAAGSPAFASLVAAQDAFVVAALRDAGAVLLGKTNMPPLADGGMQKGLYGRSTSPYNPHYLPAAYGSGSSHGSAVALTADLCAFSIGTETVSSGRSPASHNSLVAYTPSRGLVSLRGVWPLYGTRDVVVPYARSVSDLLALLGPLLARDPSTRGDLWREQGVVELPGALPDAPTDWRELLSKHSALRGRRIAVPRQYVGEGAAAGIQTRPSVLALWERAAERLRSLGAELILTDFPLVEAYEGGDPAGSHVEDLGTLPVGWSRFESQELLAYGWDSFVRDTGDPSLSSLAQADPDLMFPREPGELPDRYDAVEDSDCRYAMTVAMARAGIPEPSGDPRWAEGLRGLERLRAVLLEDWMDAHGVDLVAFPANADVAPADSDVNGDSAEVAWRNGVLFSNGNYAIRHLGVPTVTVPMGIMADTGMPVGLTFAGRAYDDRLLLESAWEFESVGNLRAAPDL